MTRLTLSCDDKVKKSSLFRDNFDITGLRPSLRANKTYRRMLRNSSQANQQTLPINQRLIAEITSTLGCKFAQALVVDESHLVAPVEPEVRSVD